jgi:DNA repair photolyase
MVEESYPLKRVEGFNQFIGEKKKISYNICIGCQNKCLNCFAKLSFCTRQRHNASEWDDMKVKKIQFFSHPKDQESYKGYILQIPTTSDIFPETVKKYCVVTRNALVKGFDEVQITTKARFDCVKEICDNFLDSTDRVHLFFTMTTDQNEVTRTWERNATLFEERLRALKYAFEKGYKTSVIIEPYLTDPRSFIPTIQEFVSQKFYIGKMNYITQLENVYYNNEFKHLFREIRDFYRLIEPNLKNDEVINKNPLLVWKK